MILMCDKCYLLHYNQARIKSQWGATDYCANCRSENYVSNEKDIAIHFVDETKPIDSHRQHLITGFELCLKLINTISFPCSKEEIQGTMAFSVLKQNHKTICRELDELQKSYEMLRQDHDMFRDRSIKLREELELKEHFNQEVLKDVHKKEAMLNGTIGHLVASFNNYLIAKNI